MSATIQTYWPHRQFTLKTDSNLVEVGVAVRDSRGRAIGGLGKDDVEIEDAGKKREIEFALKEPTYNRISESGLDMSLTLQATPGTCRLRAVAQDAIDGKIVSSTLPAEIR